MSKPRYRLIYVAGFGFSGSTLLDMLLSSDPQVFGVGEMMYLPDYVQHAKTCTCGQPLRQCPVWGRVLPQPSDANARWFEAPYHHDTYYERVERNGHVLDEADREWTRYQFELLRRLADTTGAVTFVDSSKNLTRLRMYRACCPSDFAISVVLLIRDVLGVMKSSTRWIPSKLRAARGWASTNLRLWQHLRDNDPEAVVITYRDVACSTVAVLNHVRGAAQLEPLTALPDCKLEGMHTIEGNPSRFRFGQIEYDDGWKRQLTVGQKLLGFAFYPIYVYLRSKRTMTGAR